MDTAKVLEFVRANGWGARPDQAATGQIRDQGLTLFEVRRALVTAKAVTAEGDAWRVSGGTPSKHGQAIEPLVARNLGILILEV